MKPTPASHTEWLAWRVVRFFNVFSTFTTVTVIFFHLSATREILEDSPEK